MKEQESKDILLRLNNGDESAFDAIFSTHYKYLVSIAYKYFNDIDRSRDIAQEVFLDVWKRRETLNIKDSIKFFLRRAVINQCLAQKRKSVRMIIDSDLLLKKETITDEVNEQFLFNNLNEHVNKIVSQLPERCRQVFELSRFKNLSHKEIASELDISVKTIENQMTKALKFLRLELKKLGFISIFLNFIFFI